MLFSSPTFLFFFLPAIIVCWVLTGRSRLIILAGSIFFYAWGEPTHTAVLMLVIAVNYAVGLLMGKLKAGGLHRRLMFVAGLVFNVSVLLVYRYGLFIVENVNIALNLFGMQAAYKHDETFVLGISFFSFQSIAYIIDVYAFRLAPCASLFRFALFKSFFPQLIAGPIVRYQQVSSDLSLPRTSCYLFLAGINLFCIGLAKKVLIADNLAQLVDYIYSLPTSELSGSVAWIGAIAFTFQIYYDFSGYSDMAVGMGRMFGVQLPRNFSYPYCAVSLRDFWTRWHITLSSWFRDYVYVPLGGNRRGRWRTGLNLFIVFLLCGLWHGASWNFLAWGAYNGIFLVMERGHFGRLVAALPRPLQHLYLMLTVVVGWVLFRSSNLPVASEMLGAMAGLNGWVSIRTPPEMLVSNFTAIILGAAAVGAFPWRLRVSGSQKPLLTAITSYAGPLGTALLLALSIIQISTQTHLAFIYFRF